MRRPVWPFPSLLVPLPPLPPFVLASFFRLHRLRGHRRPGRGLPGRGRRHRVSSPPLPGRSGRISLVGEPRPHPRPLYRSRLALPLRRFLTRLGEAWPYLSKIAAIRRQWNARPKVVSRLAPKGLQSDGVNEPWWCRYAATAQAKGTWAHCHGASASKRAGTGGHVPSLRMSTSHRPARAQR